MPSSRRVPRWSAAPVVVASPRTGAMIRRSLAVLIAALLAAGVLAGCTSDDGARGVAQRFIDALAAKDVDAAAALTTAPEQARPALAAAWDGLQATALSGTARTLRIGDATATVAYRDTWTLPREREWVVDGEFDMVQDAETWRVRWSEAALHPRLGPRQRMSLRSIPAARAQVQDADGVTVLAPGAVVRISLSAAEAEKTVSTWSSAQQLVAVLAPYVKGISAQAITESATATSAEYVVTRLAQDDYRAIAPVLTSIPGVHTAEEADIVPTDRTFAPELLGQVRKVVVDGLEGKAGWRVVSSNADGVDVDVLTETDPQPAPAVRLGLSRAAQVAAQRAVDVRKDLPAMFVAIQASTGDIVAVAQNTLADASGPIASTGQFPPGSIFKIVTSTAAFTAKTVTPDSTVACPGSVTIGERSVPNYNGFTIGMAVPLERAFAASCNTTFAVLASKMGPAELTTAAASMGVGRRYEVAGLPTKTGSVPPATDLTERVEDGFGQGKVLVSPFGMALVAATVAAGKTPTPRLVLGSTTQVAGPAVEIGADVVAQLRRMMRLVVTAGTARGVEQAGTVYGKTGEAEVEGGSHAWFVGFRGDLAFAALVVKGGSSDNAVTITRDFLLGLPADFRD